MTLFHYTSWFGSQAIEADAERMLRPNPTSGLLWATDLDFPNREALGIMDRSVSGDRGDIRYRVLGAREFHHWPLVRRSLPGRLVLDLEPEGSLVMHWWVSVTAVPAVIDPYATVV